MKSIIKISLVLVMAAATIFSSCGKYEDGPAISLKSKTARLCREWVDADCTSNCDATEFKKDGTIATNGTTWSGIKWAFSSDKKNLEMTITIGSASSTSSSEITRLTSKELWLKDSGGTITKNKAK
jgi:hypothetical protein